MKVDEFGCSFGGVGYVPGVYCTYVFKVVVGDVDDSVEFFV